MHLPRTMENVGKIGRRDNIICIKSLKQLIFVFIMQKNYYDLWPTQRL